MIGLIRLTQVVVRKMKKQGSGVRANKFPHRSCDSSLLNKRNRQLSTSAPWPEERHTLEVQSSLYILDYCRWFFLTGSIYCATKHAVAAFSSSLMKELVNTGIRVSEIQPGEFISLPLASPRGYLDTAVRLTLPRNGGDRILGREIPRWRD